MRKGWPRDKICKFAHFAVCILISRDHLFCEKGEKRGESCRKIVRVGGVRGSKDKMDVHSSLKERTLHFRVKYKRKCQAKFRRVRDYLHLVIETHECLIALNFGLRSDDLGDEKLVYTEMRN